LKRKNGVEIARFVFVLNRQAAKRQGYIFLLDRIYPSTMVPTYGAGRIFWIILLLCQLPPARHRKPLRRGGRG